MTRNLPGRMLMTADAVGGIWQYSLELAAGFGRRGIQVLLAVMGPAPSPAQHREAAAINGLTLRHRPYRLEWMAEADLDLAAAAHWLSDLEAEFAPEVAHINGFALASASWRCPVVVVCHSCVKSWWLAVKRCEAPAEWHGYGRRVAAGLAAADLVVAPTRSFLSTIKRIYEPDAGSFSRSAAVYNARSALHWAPVACRERLIFSCGRAWDEAKGIDLLERSAGQVAWPIYIAGNTRPPDDDRAPATLSEHVRRLDWLEPRELATWLGRASIFALPARYEPFGLAVLEAAMSGCALVLGDIDTLRELWDDAALFVDPWDEDALTAALRRLIDDPLLLAEMSARALLRARRFTPEAMIDGYLEAYGLAVDRDTRPVTAQSLSTRAVHDAAVRR